MKEKVAKKWVEALRSGKYKRADGVLKSESGGFCCLGVLCDIYRKEIKDGVWQKDKYGDILFLNEDVWLPEKVQQWAGIGTKDGELKDFSLAEKNDNGAKFSTLANIIEKNVKIL